MAWSKRRVICPKGSGTNAPSCIEPASILGALASAISSTEFVCANKIRPSVVVRTASARVPPVANCILSRVDSPINQSAAVCEAEAE